MEEWLCRKLHRHEDVHHINGDRADNRIENLLLCNRKEHFQFHPRKKGWHHTPETRAKLSAHHRSKGGRSAMPEGLNSGLVRDIAELAAKIKKEG